MYIKQGDCYKLPIRVKDDSTNAPIPVETLAGFEVMFGQRREYVRADDQNGYNSETGIVMIQLEQEETFALKANETIDLDLRVHYADGTVIGIKSKVPITIVDATSEVVL